MAEIDPNDLGRYEWISVMAAFKQAGWNHSQQDELQAKFMAWCTRYAIDDPADNLKQWRSIRGSKVGWRSILRRAPAAFAQFSFGNAGARRQKQREDNGRIGEEFGYEIHTPIMTLDEMIEHLWFIEIGSGGGAVANAKTKQCITLAIARNAYAASMETIKYVDGRSGKEKQKKVPAIELWLKSDKRKRADSISWKPNAAILCDVPEKPGQSGFNTWNGLIKPKLADQMSMDGALREAWLPAWREHLRYLIPIESERALFEQWLANTCLPTILSQV